MLFSSGTLGRFSTIPTGTLANPSMYCFGHNNLPLRLPREGKLIIPETFKLFPDISHRGPAAAAVCALATEGWDRTMARSWLERAGTDPKYKGLFATVDSFRPPSEEELGRARQDQLPERAEVPALVESMV